MIVCVNTLWCHCAISLCPYLVLRCSGEASGNLNVFCVEIQSKDCFPCQKGLSLCLSAWVCQLAAWHWNLWSLIMVLSHQENETFRSLTIITEHEHQNRPSINTIWGARLYIERHMCVFVCWMIVIDEIYDGYGSLIIKIAFCYLKMTVAMFQEWY